MFVVSEKELVKVDVNQPLLGFSCIFFDIQALYLSIHCVHYH